MSEKAFLFIHLQDSYARYEHLDKKLAQKALKVIDEAIDRGEFKESREYLREFYGENYKISDMFTVLMEYIYVCEFEHEHKGIFTDMGGIFTTRKEYKENYKL